MFIIIENLECINDTDNNLDSLINMGIAYVASNIREYRFYMFDEASASGETGNLNGTRLYRSESRPNTISWYAEDNRIKFKYQHNMDIFPISTLECVLRNVADWNNIRVKGNVSIIDTEFYYVYYYDIVDNKICKHNNKSIDLTKFYDLTMDLYDYRVPKDEEFISILQKAFPLNNYNEYLEEQGIINFVRTLITMI
jgi:hypothetical protein